METIASGQHQSLMLMCELASETGCLQIKDVRECKIGARRTKETDRMVKAESSWVRKTRASGFTEPEIKITPNNHTQQPQVVAHLHFLDVIHANMPGGGRSESPLGAAQPTLQLRQLSYLENSSLVGGRGNGCAKPPGPLCEFDELVLGTPLEQV